MIRVYVPKDGIIEESDLAKYLDKGKSFIETIHPEKYFIIKDVEQYHPNKQIKIAEKLCKENKGEDIYIITHSAHFAEALEVYSRRYDNPAHFYLWNDIFNVEFKGRPGTCGLCDIYNALGKSYDELDKIRGENSAWDVVKKRYENV